MSLIFNGTTGVACKNLNRDFIGVEKDEKYFQIAKDRIENNSVEVQLNKAGLEGIAKQEENC